jgi:hypothetical protein
LSNVPVNVKPSPLLAPYHAGRLLARLRWATQQAHLSPPARWRSDVVSKSFALLSHVARRCAPPGDRQRLEEGVRDLAGQFEAGPHVVALEERTRQDEPVVYCERDGRWWAGRYVGVIRHKGGRLTVEPRFGLATLASWLGQAVDAVLVRSPGRLREDVPFVVQLLALVWGRAFADAARHGLPVLRLDRRHVGSVVRGRLDVRGTLGEMVAGREAAVSVKRERSLDNPAGRVLAAAYRVLRRSMGPGTHKRLPTWLSHVQWKDFHEVVGSSDP